MTRVETAEEAKAFYNAHRNPVGWRIPVMRSGRTAAKRRRHELAIREAIIARARAILPPPAGD
jgi:hypothetical protein